jgi:hydroxyacylglutathione hydrolase
MRNALAALLVLSLALGFVACEDDASSGSSNSSAPGSGGSGAATTTGGGGQGQGAGMTTGGGGNTGGGGMAPTNNGFPNQWIDGTNCAQEPDVQIWAYADDTFILRQSLCTNFEGPFIYLLLGQDMAFVQDTGTGAANLFAEVESLVDAWASSLGKTNFPVVVTHSHGHGDHTGGDGQFQGQANYTLVSPSTNAVINYFMFNDWPNDTVQLDLGSRVLDIVGIPGHQSAHVAVYDPTHQLLLTGDTLYPGRLYINNWNDYRASTQRMVDFVAAGHPVQWVLGTHIELSAMGFGNDYQFGATQHPNEHTLQLDYSVLEELNTACIAMGNNPTNEPHEHFIIFP